MAVPQLQLANLGEIFARNQAQQAQMDTMQLEQAEALAARDARVKAAEREAKLREAIASGVNPSTPEGLGQLASLMSTEDYFKALDTQSKVKLADIRGEAAQRTAGAAETRAKAAERTAVASERRVNAQVNRYRAQNRIDQARLDLDRQNTEREYGADLTETFINTSVNILGLPLKEQKDAYNAAKPLIEARTGEKLPEWENGGQDAVKGFAAMRKPQGKGGTVTMPDGTVIESGNFNETQKLRKEYLDQSKNFIDVRDSYSRLQAVAADPSAAGDISMIFSYMKMLDPGSVVREGEQATAQNAAGIPDRIRNLYNKTITGERLSPNQRQDFVNQGQKLYNKASEQQQKSSSMYQNIAQKSGLTPDLAVPDITLAQPNDPLGLRQ